MSADRQIFCPKSLVFFMGLLEELRTAVEHRALSGGGWASGNGTTASIETTCYGLMALRTDQEPARRKAIESLSRTQNQDGSWPAFQGDDAEGCWTTSLAVITLLGHSDSSAQRGVQWLIGNAGRESHWFWNLKFRIADRKVRFDPNKYGWPWTPGSGSWDAAT